MKNHWKILDSETMAQEPFFRLRKDRCQLPDGRVMPSYYVMEFVDWVQVVAVTEDQQVILVKQYRHAAEGEFLEVPGGSTHLHGSEEPVEAAKRELVEETGYQSDRWTQLGELYPNPALLNNRVHTFLATGCRKVADLNLDEFEEIEVQLIPVAELLQMVDEGKFQHALMLASLALARKSLIELGR